MSGSVSQRQIESDRVCYPCHTFLVVAEHFGEYSFIVLLLCVASVNRSYNCCPNQENAQEHNIQTTFASQVENTDMFGLPVFPPTYQSTTRTRNECEDYCETHSNCQVAISNMIRHHLTSRSQACSLSCITNGTCVYVAVPYCGELEVSRNDPG